MITLFYSRRSLHFLPLLTKLYLLIIISCPSAAPLSFNFSSFNQENYGTIFREGDAYIDSQQSLYLTKSAEDQQKTGSVGRATYKTPFLLRDNSTGKLADFRAEFTFSITSVNQSTNLGDGLAFFLAPNGSLLNKTLGSGASLGLPFNNTQVNGTTQTNEYPFVAVEFDIYPNIYYPIEDLRDSHVGIDVNTLKSNITQPWNGVNLANGSVNRAWISYNSSTKNLSVAFSPDFLQNSSTSYVQVRNFSYVVDLLQYLPDLVIVGFSASTGMSIALHKILSWDFDSTALDQFQPKSGNDNIRLAVGLGVAGSVTMAGGLAFVWFILWRKNKKAPESDEDPMNPDEIDDEFEKETGPRKFSYGELARATSDFHETEKLGQGGFGGVYKGFIQDLNSYVAVKRISQGSKQGLKEYATEVRIISRLRHRNLVQLIGWCHKKQELLLVYEFMPNRSLDYHLFKEKVPPLTWKARYQIAQGLASGLLYLHQEWDQCVVHRDIKSSNVMLDANFNPKLGDFGLARLVDHGKQSQTTVLAGTMGYMAPECVNTGKASKETDIYSFGVVALEIACGRKPIDPKLESNQINIVEWVWQLYGQGKVSDASDPQLCGEFDQKEIECMLIVGLWCAHPDYIIRPSIQQAIQVLNFDVPFPILPSKMPVATYSAPPVSFSMFSDNSITGPGASQTESSSNGYSTNSSQITSSSTTNSHSST